MIRAASPSDIAELVALDQDCFGSDAWTADSWTHEIGRGNVTVLAAGSTIAAVAVTMPIGPDRELLKIAVAPVYRRQGYGEQLLRHLIASAREAGCDRMLLEVEHDNTAALELYVAGGFAVVGRRENYYGPGRHALLLDLELDGGTNA